MNHQPHFHIIDRFCLPHRAKLGGMGEIRRAVLALRAAGPSWMPGSRISTRANANDQAVTWNPDSAGEHARPAISPSQHPGGGPAAGTGFQQVTRNYRRGLIGQPELSNYLHHHLLVWRVGLPLRIKPGVVHRATGACRWAPASQHPLFPCRACIRRNPAAAC